MSRRRHHAPRQAAATVELAVTLAFLILPVFLGLWEMSCVIEANQLLSNACREAGRQAAGGARSPTEVEQAVRNYLSHHGVDVSRVVVTLTNLTSTSRSDPRYAEQMDHFRIHARVPYADLRPGSTATIIQLLGVLEVEASADWFSMKDIPVTVDGTIPIE
ncbi:MAG: pilus assembly protein [Gemmatales bacterium]|nr:pilus assembly protein [Gemmatales bacterium]MDW8386492.1 pilus assembly protein [Gemmatales bacterium]